MNYQVCFSRKSFFVVIKPAGMPTLPGRLFPSLAEAIIEEMPEQALIKPSGEAGIVHRLDNEASGLVVVARNQAAYDDLRKMFSAGKVHKEYTVLVHGYLPRSGKIEAMISTHAKSGKRVCISPAGQKAVTSYKLIRHYLLDGKPCSLTVARTCSGKRHQVRMHFLHIGHPVVSDSLYAKKFEKKISRMFFHASRIEFEYEGERMIIESDLSDELKHVLKKLTLRR